MALPDQLADLERKVAARFSEALAEILAETRRAVQTETQRSSSAMLAELAAIAPPAAHGLLAEEDLLESVARSGCGIETRPGALVARSSRRVRPRPHSERCPRGASRGGPTVRRPCRSLPDSSAGDRRLGEPWIRRRSDCRSLGRARQRRRPDSSGSRQGLRPAVCGGIRRARRRARNLRPGARPLRPAGAARPNRRSALPRCRNGR